MNISTEQLHAFLTVYSLGSFTKGAAHLGLTQSALSQKIARLEASLEADLFIRKGHEIFLTSSGEKLLVFAKQQLQQEEEFLSQFRQDQKELAGVFRIASFSSLLRSCIIPSLAPWMREHPRVNIEFQSYEVIELVDVLKRNQADCVLLDYFPQLPGFVEEQIGIEEYVVVESTKFSSPKNLYFDHGPHDNATEAFFQFQGKVPFAYRRGFMGDIYGVLDAVALGLGRAVMSKHIIKNDNRVKIVKGHKRYSRPLVLVFYSQNYFPKLHYLLIEELKKNMTNFF